MSAIGSTVTELIDETSYRITSVDMEGNIVSVEVVGIDSPIIDSRKKYTKGTSSIDEREVGNGN